MKFANNVLRKFSQYTHEWKRGYKPKSHVILKYEALPDYLSITGKDPFEYKLRSFEQVKKDYLKLKGKVKGEVELTRYVQEAEENRNKNRDVKISYQIADFRFTEKQKKRMIILLGPKFNAKTGVFLIKVDYFMEWEQNLDKAREIIQELVLEALRAP